MTTERRFFTATELRAALGTSPRIVGHAAVFNQLSEDLVGFREKIAPGAFADTIKSADIRALWNHDPNFPLARTKSGTLKLKEDDSGLAIDAELPDTTFARDLLKSIERGDVDQMSFGFRVMPDGQKWAMQDGGLVRTLTNVELFDVSPVTFPAYPQTDVGVRTLAAEMRAKIEGETGEQAVAEQKKKAAELARLKEREEFLARRAPIPDPLSLAEVIKKARIQTVFKPEGE